MKRRWLQDWPWETVITINAGLCKEKNALHKPTSDGYQPAQKLWESAVARELTLFSYSSPGKTRLLPANACFTF